VGDQPHVEARGECALLPQLLANGVLAGAGYAIMALGFAVIYQPTRVLHIAHGVVYTAAAYIAYALFRMAGAPWPEAFTGGWWAGIRDRRVHLPGDAQVRHCARAESAGFAPAGPASVSASRGRGVGRPCRPSVSSGTPPARGHPTPSQAARPAPPGGGAARTHTKAAAGPHSGSPELRRGRPPRALPQVRGQTEVTARACRMEGPWSIQWH
jgi:hypothetical protein